MLWARRTIGSDATLTTLINLISLVTQIILITLITLVTLIVANYPNNSDSQITLIFANHSDIRK